MAHLWVKDDSDEWAVVPLEGDAFALSGERTVPVRRSRGNASDGPVVVVSSGGPPPTWAVLAAGGSDVRVNGVPLAVGIRVLGDRDEIRLPGGAIVYFSLERLARVERFPGSDHPLFCPRCRQEVARGAEAVRCPQCDVWHHQSDERPCWTYAAVCALCDRSTDLEAGYTWTP